jgi:CRP-like cAMP-binding protein
MTPKTLEQIFKNEASTLKLKRGDTLYQQGEHAEAFYFLESGLLGLVVAGASGKEHLIRLFQKGRHMGHRALLTQEPYHASARALENSIVRRISAPRFYEFLNSKPEVALHFLKIMGQDLRKAELRICQATELSVRGRISEALIYLLEQYPEHKWTKQEIAEFIGSSTPTVFRAIADLEAEGLIHTQRRDIEILDRAKLLDYSNKDE